MQMTLEKKNNTYTSHDDDKKLQEDMRTQIYGIYQRNYPVKRNKQKYQMHQMFKNTDRTHPDVVWT